MKAALGDNKRRRKPSPHEDQTGGSVAADFADPRLSARRLSELLDAHAAPRASQIFDRAERQTRILPSFHHQCG
jgi:hypothetical protein